MSKRGIYNKGAERFVGAYETYYHKGLLVHAYEQGNKQEREKEKKRRKRERAAANKAAKSAVPDTDAPSDPRPPETPDAPALPEGLLPPSPE